MSGAERVASMSPDELIAVIERGLNADEQAARVCSGDGQWTAEDIASIGPNLGVEPRQHMARHAPARVLADVESKREVIRLYRDTLDMIQTLKGHGYDAKAHEVASESYLNVLQALARPYLAQGTQ